MQERIFFLFRLVCERPFRLLAVVGERAGFDLALLREGCTQHMEWLIGSAFDGAVLFVEDFNGQVVTATVDVYSACAASWLMHPL